MRSEIAYPCFYGGGGSCAFDRRKFLELGGFDELLAPFYLEDTDLGYMAWKRGWKVLYEPRSMVYHEHRGTIGKTFHERTDRSVLKKNFICSAGRTSTSGRGCSVALLFSFAGAALSLVFGDSPERAELAGIVEAPCCNCPQALRSRAGRAALAAITDTEAFLRPLGGYFRDRFQDLCSRDPDAAAGAVSLAVSDLPAGPRRRGFHVADGPHLAALAHCT